MNVRRHQLTREIVQTAVDVVLSEAATSGRAATVTALAKQLQITRQTLYRDFADETADLLRRDAERRSSRPPARTCTGSDAETIARLRREKSELTRHLIIYEDHIRRLTIENTRLTQVLANQSKITRLDDHRPISARAGTHLIPIQDHPQE
ncbi:hypothetical protein [Kitasatospora sp. GP82]|uniref:hypothetical protein n=1 Tax=Kitasatospora sp. GP82 TaxID=3035089 RepID=UPI002473BC20|nr:hypothetical protein [Kitasatospora sp. GP82]MDH6129860.1 transposase-like protein [Kitasatospora sp. GP82]